MNGPTSRPDEWPDPANEPPATAEESGLKQRTAALSILSNSGLILLKVIAGTITGSVAILTEAVHSSIDLVASIVAFFSVRKAGSRRTSRTATARENREPVGGDRGILILVRFRAILEFGPAIRRLLGTARCRNSGSASRSSRCRLSSTS